MSSKVNIRLLLAAFLCLVFGLGILQFFRNPDYGAILGSFLGDKGFFHVGLGLALLLCGVAAISSYVFGSRARGSVFNLVPIVVGGVLVLLHTLAGLAGKDWAFLEIIEQAARVGTPVLLILALQRTAGSTGILYGLAKILIALTFIGHGVLALGWFSPIPESFLAMVDSCLGLDPDARKTFLTSVGILDLLAAVGIFFPATQRPALYYMVAWGFLTAIARPWANFDGAEALTSLVQWVPEALSRAPHFLLPLFLLSKPRGIMGSSRLDISRL